MNARPGVAFQARSRPSFNERLQRVDLSRPPPNGSNGSYQAEESRPKQPRQARTDFRVRPEAVGCPSLIWRLLTGTLLRAS
jgi:hypothetical protein